MCIKSCSQKWEHCRLQDIVNVAKSLSGAVKSFSFLRYHNCRRFFSFPESIESIYRTILNPLRVRSHISQGLKIYLWIRAKTDTLFSQEIQFKRHRFPQESLPSDSSSTLHMKSLRLLLSEYFLIKICVV